MSIRILYVEDDSELRISTTKLLRQKGYTVKSFEVGENALSAYKKNPHDIILCDLNLPGMNGIELLEGAIAIQSDVRCIVLTAHGSIPLAVKALKKGAHDFILKPFKIEEIEASITQALKKNLLESDLNSRINELNDTTMELAGANIKLLSIQEELEKKNVEREVLLDELSNARDELQAIINAAPAALIMVDNNGRITSANECVESIFGMKVKELLKLSFDEFLNRIKRNFEDFKRFEKTVSKELVKSQISFDEMAEPPNIIEESLKLITPAERYVTFYSFPVYNHMNEKLGRVWSISDVTKLREADEQIRVIVEVTPIPFIITQIENGKILYANQPLADLAGMTKEEMIGKATPDFYNDPRDRQIILKKLTRNGYLNNHEVLIKKADGSTIWMIFALAVTKVGSTPVVVGALYDIDERRKAEDRVKESEKRFRTVWEKSTEGMRLSDEKGNVVAVNNAFADIVGMKKSELEGYPISKIYSVDSDLKRIMRKHIDRFKKGTVRKFMEREITLWSEKSVVLEVTNTFIEMDQQRLLLSIFKDITQHKMADNALMESEERFRNLVENANDIIYSLSLDGTFTYVSPNWTEILGHSVEEVLSRSFADYVHPDDLESCWEFLSKVVESGEKQSGIEYRVKHKDGRWRWHATNASPYKDKDGNVEYFVGISHDITQRKKILDDLEKANRDLKDTQIQLVQSEKMASLGLLVAGIAHEINTPLGAVNSMHDTLLRLFEKLKGTVNIGKVNSSEKDNVDKIFRMIDDANKVISQGTTRVQEIVRRLRSFARLDEAELQEVDIHEGLEDTLSLVQHELKHNVEIIRDYGNLPRISCFAGQLNQIFVNLIMNAIQSFDGKGVIKIKTRLVGENVEISFTDNGKGIPMDKIKKIFDPGYTTKGVGIGTGLGLSICYKIIQDQMGEIKVESEVGAGSTFTVVLPRNLDVLLERK